MVNLLLHLKRSDTCAAQYNVPAMEAEEARRRKERKAITDKEHYKQNTPQKRAASKEYYDSHTPEKRTASKEYYKTHTPEKQASMTEYNKKHQGDINQAMKYLRLDPEKREEDTKTKKIYNAEHREERRDKARKHYQKNKEKAKAYYQKNKERILERMAKLRKAHLTIRLSMTDLWISIMP